MPKVKMKIAAASILSRNSPGRISRIAERVRRFMHSPSVGPKTPMFLTNTIPSMSFIRVMASTMGDDGGCDKTQPRGEELRNGARNSPGHHGA
ncbi:MAG TPA: hypothetical protein GXX51_00450 [Firmicutes bacterium]|nr:hypothetical protein [Bacillota bacterium]